MNRRRTLIFAAAVALLYGLGIFWGLPSALSAASDSPAPLGPLAFVAEYRDPSKSYIYPAVHQLLLVCVYAPIVIFCKLTGQLGSLSGAWPYGFKDPTAVFSAFILAGNLVSLAMGVGVLLLLRRIRPTETYADWFAMTLTALGGVYTYYARVANLDVPYLFWWMLGYVCLWRYLFDERETWRREGRRLLAPTGRKLLALSAVASALAIGTKDQAAGLILGFGLVLLFVAPRGEEGGWMSRVRAAAFFSVALIAAYALVAVATNPWRWVHHVRFVTSDHVLPEFEQSVRGQIQLFGRAIIRLSHVMSPVGLLLGAAGLAVLWRARKHRELLALALPAAAYYVSIIAKVRATEERYLLPIALVLAVSAGVMVGAALAADVRRARWVRAGVLVLAAVALLQQFALGFVPVTYTQLFDARRALARDIDGFVPEGSPLLVADMPSFNVPNRRVYERYKLTHPPGERLFPPSTHGENLFHPYDPAHRFILSGNATPQSAWWPNAQSRWPDTDVELVARWTYPDWIKRHVHVPSVYEYYLFRRRRTPTQQQSAVR